MLKRILIIVVIFIITISYSFYQKHQIDQTLVVSDNKNTVLTQIPNADFKTFQGEIYNLKNNNGPVFVHFWATWCAPCEAELPELLKMINSFKETSISFYLVAANDDLIKIQKFLKSLNYTEQSNLVWLLDNDNLHQTMFNTFRLPESFLFGVDQKLVKKFLGPQEWNQDFMKSLIQNSL